MTASIAQSTPPDRDPLTTLQASEEIVTLKQALQAILYEVSQVHRDQHGACDRIRDAAQAAIGIAS